MVTEQADVKTERRRQREQDPGRSEWAAKAALARWGQQGSRSRAVGREEGCIKSMRW